MAAIDAPGMLLTPDLQAIDVTIKEREATLQVPRDPRFAEVNALDEQRLIREMSKMEDPVFAEGEVAWTVEEAGFPLDKIEEYDTEFKKMYDDMFSRSSEMGVMGAGDFEARLRELKNELSDSKIESSNGGGINVLSTGEQAIHPPQRPSTPFYFDVQIPIAGPLVSPSEGGGDASDSKVNDE